jgi:DNA-binding NtrC family response regulator
MKDVLIIDDEASITEAIGDLLRRNGLSSEAATDRDAALLALKTGRFRCVLLDLRMPGVEGFDLLRSLLALAPRIPVVMISAHGSVPSAVQAMKVGAMDFVLKPVEKEDLLRAMREALLHHESEENTTDLYHELLGEREAVFRDPRSLDVAKAAQRASQVTLPVLILGENGTGKEVFAKLVHELGPRAKAPFVKVNCAAIPEALFESDLFGHEKGAFTGAVVAKPGRVEIAQGGTLFLDEIGELAKTAQAKLLQFLQDHTYERLGGVRTLKADVRVVAATNRMNIREVLREDLLYRLSGITLHVSPLRERPGDIEPIVRHMIRKSGRKLTVAPGTFDALRAHPWPGNVRELEHRIEKAIAFSVDGVIRASDILGEERATGGLRDQKKAFERQRVVDTLRETKNNRTEAAKRLDISRRMLQKKLKEFGIE